MRTLIGPLIKPVHINSPRRKRNLVLFPGERTIASEGEAEILGEKRSRGKVIVPTHFGKGAKLAILAMVGSVALFGVAGIATFFWGAEHFVVFVCFGLMLAFFGIGLGYRQLLLKVQAIKRKVDQCSAQLATIGSDVVSSRDEAAEKFGLVELGFMGLEMAIEESSSSPKPEEATLDLSRVASNAPHYTNTNLPHGLSNAIEETLIGQQRGEILVIASGDLCQAIRKLDLGARRSSFHYFEIDRELATNEQIFDVAKFEHILVWLPEDLNEVPSVLPGAWVAEFCNFVAGPSDSSIADRVSQLMSGTPVNVTKVPTKSGYVRILLSRGLEDDLSNVKF